MLDLEVRKLSFSVADKRIISDISLAVEHGEYVGIIGPNGSGKSTLLKNIYRLLQPRTGEIILFGRNVLEESLVDTARDMATLGQFQRVNFNFSVWDMVSMGRTPHLNRWSSLNKDDVDIIERALLAVDMLDRKNDSFQLLSGGEQQRVSLARVLAQEPRFLLLDEPTNHLDIRYQIQLMELSKKLGIGTLTVLHDLNLATLYCERIYVLKDGQVRAHGKPADILTRELVEDVYEISCDVIMHDDRPVIIYGREEKL